MRDILLEDKRQSLLSKAKKGGLYAPSNQYNGKNRYERRLKSKVASSVKQFNSIDMDKFFKTDILDVNVDVVGESSTYVVRLSFVGTLDELHNFMKNREGAIVDRKTISKSLTRAFNSGDVFFNCSCPDFRYRHSYHATQEGNIVGQREDRPIRKDSATVRHAGGDKGSNYNNDKGPTCKHITLCLSDASWLIRVASVIYNYINYMKDHSPKLYEKYIYPAIYQEPYGSSIQLDISDIEDLPPDTDIPIEEYQKLVDDDIEKNGRISLDVMNLIDDANLSLVKQGNRYIVKNNRLSSQITKLKRKENGEVETDSGYGDGTNKRDIYTKQDVLPLDKSNKYAQDKFDNYKFKKTKRTQDDGDEDQMSFRF